VCVFTSGFERERGREGEREFRRERERKRATSSRYCVHIRVHLRVHMRVNTRVNVADSQAAQKVSISWRDDDAQGARARVLVIGTQFSATSDEPFVHRCGVCESYSRNSIPYPYRLYRASVCLHVCIYVHMYVCIMHACMHVSGMHACIYVREQRWRESAMCDQCECSSP
jgi:hypothetical protein